MNSHSMILPAAVAAVDNNTIKTLTHNDMQNGMYCRRCGYGGCDVRIMSCGCSVHAVSNSPSN